MIFKVTALNRMLEGEDMVEIVEADSWDDVHQAFHNQYDEDVFEISSVERISRIDANDSFLLDDYLNDPQTQQGWAQQDLIDIYRRER